MAGYQAEFNKEVYVSIAEDGSVANWQNKKKTVSERVFDVVAILDIDVDNNYGADIDGNRGCRQEFVEDVTIESIKETDEDGNVTDVDFDTLPKDVQADIMETIIDNGGNRIEPDYDYYD